MDNPPRGSFKDGLGLRSASGGIDLPDINDLSAHPIPKTGRRSAPRLRLSLPGRLQAIEGSHRCVILNVSRTGAQIAILSPLRVGEGAMLECGKLESFVIVKRAEFGMNALEFEEPLDNKVVLDIRRYYENFEEREKRQLIETARKWVNGDLSDERAI